jgi:hypothetical protein
MSQVGVCIECETKHHDVTLKTVFQCSYCERYVCDYHLPARLAYIVDLKSTSKKAKETRKIVEEDYARGDGHPCLPYSLEFWKWFESEKTLRIERRKNLADGFGYFSNEEIYRKSLEKEENLPEYKAPTKLSGEKDTSLSLKEKLKRIFQSKPRQNELNELEQANLRQETVTTENKYGHRFVVPLEVYSNAEYREYLNSAETIKSVRVIVKEYCRKYHLHKRYHLREL